MKKAKKVLKKKVRTTAERRRAAKLSWARRKAKAELDKQMGPVVSEEFVENATPPEAQGGKNIPDAVSLPKKVEDGSFVSVYKSDGDLFITVAAPNTIYTRHITPAELRGIVQQAVWLLPTP